VSCAPSGRTGHRRLVVRPRSAAGPSVQRSRGREFPRHREDVGHREGGRGRAHDLAALRPQRGQRINASVLVSFL